ncbi:transient receptor potential cation channel subfamily M member-like 2 isoform X3 [Patiria miniata]|uniref:Nudix hydrolase domain-containing protein n=1 Tax=Patiria miniata TaxID=46514 RepID=A0A914BMH0_PATMI|nr:transient receptor potential cation channel subfamily M member-like 2 isoform X1 [Patiria miniata]XP_038076673.1 transient receptor potential cation channel subfamily M member-like 2 isoform X1 [Patiria miniata]XP_038076674.1 transient receptor potential cation channel subfamily M member-like 2 isoform X1 [Patiria miniata]XP_038076675.1 transient receptor potential cation channel subfamily M member-like 2 isoform X1 [Patiria miniata]XP_038076676.1 transient receptor potential cation channel 
MSASAHTSVANLKAHQNKVAPNGLVKKEKVVNVGRKQRKRRGSIGSSINLAEPHNFSWIRNNIGMRECIRFTEAPVPRDKPDPIPDDPQCQCGKRRSYHDPRYQKNHDPKAKWRVDTHTHNSATNAYGEIEFIGAAGAGLSVKLRKYIRVDHKIHSQKLMELLNDHWHLGTPKLLISVTGGARDFPMSNKLKNVFRKGLVKAALSTGAWIITGGTYAGVMKYVGEAVRDYALLGTAAGHSNVVCIGFASWGAIDQRDKLIDDRGRFPAYYRMDTKKPKGVLLDPNHTHFILADNGTEGKFGVEIKLRAKMEKEISEQKMSGVANVSVPVVCVVVEGGPNTIATVYEAIMNGTPAVIVSGTGRAADILAFAFQRAPLVDKLVKDSKGNIKKEKRTVISDALSVRIADMLCKEFGEKELDTHLTRIKEMLMRRHLITVYELGGGTQQYDIDSAILHALLKANKGQVQDQLQLALIWNRVDVAKREIFTEDRDWKKGELDDALHYALVNNQTDFVKLFMENGVSLKDYLTVRELTLLYNEVKPNTLLYELLEKARGKSTRKFNLFDVGKVIEELTMDTYETLYIRNQAKYVLTEAEIDGEDVMAEEAYETGVGKGYVVTQSHVREGLKELATRCTRDALHDLTDHFPSPVRELFLLAIMQNRCEMARMLWEDGNEAVASALTASMILKLMSDREDDPDQSAAMLKHAEEYEELAIGVLNECYNDDPERTSLLLVREQDNWGKSTSLSLAKHAKNKNFIAHSGVQNLLTEIWNGKLSDENNGYLLWLCMICPFIIPFTVIFREDESEEEEKQDWKPRHNIDLNLNQGLPYNLQGDKLGDSLKVVKTEEPVTLRGGSSASNVALCDPDEDPENAHHYEETTGIDIIDSGKELSWWQRFTLFYDAPLITFRHNVVSFVCFLGLFSYIILVNFKEQCSPAEIVLYVWVATLAFEELRQIAQEESNSWRIRFVSWLSEYWNIVDLAALILFGVGVALRFNSATLDIARIILALDLLIYFVRLLQIFSIHKNLGPKLIMIQRMMIDLLFFLCILLVFLLGFGIASQAILQPNSSSFVDIARGVFYKPYFQIFGELFLEDILENVGCVAAGNATPESGVYPCPVTAAIGTLLLFFYMMLSNVLLLNLLIAMFSYTFSAVQDNTDVYWRFQRYDLIQEYFSRPPLVPPFIIISHIFLVVRFMLQKFCRVCLRYRSGEMKQRIPPSKVKQLVLWETIQSDEYIVKEKALLAEDITEQVKSTGDKVDDLLVRMEELFADPETGVPSKALGLLGEKAMEERLNRLEDQMERTNQAIDWVIMALHGNKLGHNDGLPELKQIEPRKEQDNFDNEEEERKVPTTLEELGIALHQKARSSPYPGTAIRRFLVPDEKVPWECNFSSYRPVSYTHSQILDMPHYADIDLLQYNKKERPILNFNSYDKAVNHDRQSFTGNYNITDGIPQNPRGRTGMIGRGLLGRFGPNHAADPIVTRWKKNADGFKMEDNGLMVLEFIAIQRKDNQQWAIPGGMVEPGGVVSETLKREFGEEAMGSMEKSPEEIAAIHKNIEELFQHGVEVYKGYVDDPRNTDHAWMETVAMNFHDEEGTSVGLLELQAGDDAQGVRWQRVSSKIPLFASHQAMLRKVAELHNAAF